VDLEEYLQYWAEVTKTREKMVEELHWRGGEKGKNYVFFNANYAIFCKRIEGTITTDVVAYTMNEEEDAGVYGFMDE